MKDYMRKKADAFALGVTYLNTLGLRSIIAGHDVVYFMADAKEDDATMARLKHGWHWTPDGYGGWAFFT